MRNTGIQSHQQLIYILRIQRYALIALIGFGLLLSVAPARAAEVALQWDPNPEPEVVGYVVYYGTASRGYEWSIDVGNVTTFTVPDLEEEVTYYFAVIAYDSANLHSDYSAEVMWSDSAPANLSGTIGSHITISDSGFGTKKGKVLIGNTAAKVISWDDSSITCQIKKPLPPDAYDIVVQSKATGGEQVVYPGVFTMMSPEILSVSLTSGSQEGEIEISGNHFGSKKGKVFVNNNKCKIRSWTMDQYTGESHVTCILSQAMARGDYDVNVINKVDSATWTGGLTIP